LESDSLGEMLLLALRIGLKAFFSMAETALTHASRARLRQLRSEGVRWPDLAEEWVEDSLSVLTTVYLGIILVQFVTAASAVFILVPPSSRWIAGLLPVGSAAVSLSVVIVVFLLALVTLVLGQMLPKSLAMCNLETMALRIAPIFRTMARLLVPAVKALSMFSPLAEFLLGGECPGVGVLFVTGERVKEWVDAGEEGGVIEEDGKEISLASLSLAIRWPARSWCAG